VQGVARSDDICNDTLFKGLSTEMIRSCLWQGNWLFIMPVKRGLRITVCKCQNIIEQCHEQATQMGHFMNGYPHVTLMKNASYKTVKTEKFLTSWNSNGILYWL
jgi:hypothetical protein